MISIDGQIKHWRAQAERTDSRHLASVYRRKAADLELSKAINERRKRSMKSDNAMRMEMDYPSEACRVVSGPLREDKREPKEEMVIQNRAAVFLQAISALRRDDLKHFQDLMARLRALSA